MHWNSRRRRDRLHDATWGDKRRGRAHAATSSFVAFGCGFAGNSDSASSSRNAFWRELASRSELANRKLSMRFNIAFSFLDSLCTRIGIPMEHRGLDSGILTLIYRALEIPERL